jgi:hypothetical protein
VFTQYWELEYKNIQTFQLGLTSILGCLHDKELPVKIRAALSLRYLIQNEHSEDAIRSIIPQLLDVFFKLMNEIDNDELINTLELIIENYSEEMVPYAVVLCSKLSEAFLRIASTQEDDEGDGALTALECLGAIQTILNAVHEMPQLYPQLEEILLPMLHVLMSPDSSDYFEEGVRIISFLTYFSKKISGEMWKLFPFLVKAYDEWGPDFLNDLLPPLDNYISYDTQTFLEGGIYLQLVSDIYMKTLTKNCGEFAIRDACQLIEVVILNCKGHIDHLIDMYLQLAMSALNTYAKKSSTKVMLLEVFANAIIYNPALALNIMESRNWTSFVFSLWFQLVPNFTRTHDKKIAICALCSLLALPNEALPMVVKGGYKQIAETTVKMSFDLMKLKEQIALDADKEDEDEEEEEEDDDGELDETEDFDDIEAADLAKAASAAYKDDEDDGDDDEDDELEDETDIDSPLDKVDELILFSDHMKALSMRDATLFQMILSNPEMNKQFQEVIQQAEHRRANPPQPAK